MTQHASLDAARWSAFSRDQQLLMIANEMNRASRLFGPEDRTRLANAYERVLRLADLTVQVQPSRSLRRELLRWREMAGSVYLEPDERQHRELFRALLLLTPESAKQLPYLLGGFGGPSPVPPMGGLGGNAPQDRNVSSSDSSRSLLTAHQYSRPCPLSPGEDVTCSDV